MKIGQVLNIDINEKIDLDNPELPELTIYSAARWWSLMKGLDVITGKAKQLNIDLNNDKSWVKPLALQKYIDEETPSVIAEIKNVKTRDE
tara:strand:+ start:522 stop:791 length:270 start_codon:yes stop_codon:yes gene_type:complete